MTTPTLSPTSRRLLTLALAGILSACAGESGEMQEEAGTPPDALGASQVTVTDVGLMTPESVLHDAEADVYLVSNINGGPLEADGNGFISRVAPDGEVVDLKWIDGETEAVTLNAPKGMAIDGEVLYVADIDCLRMFDVMTGVPQGEVCIEGATFLNDVATHPAGGVLVTDSGLNAAFESTGADALYHVAGGEYRPVLMDGALGAPNGVAVHDGDIYMVTFMSGRVLNVTGEGESVEANEVLAVEGAQLDGLEFLDDGRALVSNWATSCVHILDTDGSLTCAMPDLDAPADIGVDRRRGHVLVPLFNENALRFIPL